LSVDRPGSKFLKLLRRILLTAVVTSAIIFVSVRWIAPVALSFYASRKAPAVARVVPIDLKDNSVSQAPGMRLSYFGYEFEIPWTDLDVNQTKLYPQDKPAKNKVDLHFRSGLRLMVSAIPPREWANGLSTELGVSQQAVVAAFGQETMKSDYTFVRSVYEFTPANMNHWRFSQEAQSRDEFLLMIKSVALSKYAQSGIFNLQNKDYKGFQQGNPQVRENGIEVNLYSDEGSVEFILSQKGYQNPAGVTQPEINRIVQSLSKAPLGGAAPAQVARKTSKKS